MSDFAVKIEKVSKVEKHPNADRLDLLHFEGLEWQCVTGKNTFKEGDLCLYFPIDSILPPEVENVLFSPDSKVKLNNSRIKTIRLRGAISQGMAVRPETLSIKHYLLGADLTTQLGIKKYEPKVKGSSNMAPQSTRRRANPYFNRYTDIQNAKNYPALFEEGEEVVVTEKLHGTNFRAGYVKYYKDTLWKKIKALFGIYPSHEFVFGSHHVQLQNRMRYKGYYDKNVYNKIVKMHALEDSLQDYKGYVFYGEIVGPSIQTGYHYGLKDKEIAVYIFDVSFEGKYLDTAEAQDICKALKLNWVPVLYKGPFYKEHILSLRDGDSTIGNQKIKEGIVVKPETEGSSYNGRKVLKYISDNYLLEVDDSEGLAH